MCADAYLTMTRTRHYTWTLVSHQADLQMRPCVGLVETVKVGKKGIKNEEICVHFQLERYTSEGRKRERKRSSCLVIYSFFTLSFLITLPGFSATKFGFYPFINIHVGFLLECTNFEFKNVYFLLLYF